MQHQHKATKTQIQLKDSRGLLLCQTYIVHVHFQVEGCIWEIHPPRKYCHLGGISQYGPQIIYDISCQYHEIHPKSEINIDSENVVNFVFQTLRNIFGLQNNSHDICSIAFLLWDKMISNRFILCYLGKFRKCFCYFCKTYFLCLHFHQSAPCFRRQELKIIFQHAGPCKHC